MSSSCSSVPCSFKIASSMEAPGRSDPWHTQSLSHCCVGWPTSQTLKGETVPESLPATPKSPPTRRVPSSEKMLGMISIFFEFTKASFMAQDVTWSDHLPGSAPTTRPEGHPQQDVDPSYLPSCPRAEAPLLVLDAHQASLGSWRQSTERAGMRPIVIHNMTCPRQQRLNQPGGLGARTHA